MLDTPLKSMAEIINQNKEEQQQHSKVLPEQHAGFIKLNDCSDYTWPIFEIR